ncbi:hypothetical protein J6590_018986 [Homalodisca vitripennis]|nr:hypothetical protein J6590_018986 [Homalodisca vitripennis]
MQTRLRGWRVERIIDVIHYVYQTLLRLSRTKPVFRRLILLEGRDTTPVAPSIARSFTFVGDSVKVTFDNYTVEAAIWRASQSAGAGPPPGHCDTPRGEGVRLVEAITAGAERACVPLTGHCTLSHKRMKQFLARGHELEFLQRTAVGGRVLDRPVTRSVAMELPPQDSGPSPDRAVVGETFSVLGKG